jgi:hypothetical protein
VVVGPQVLQDAGGEKAEAERGERKDAGLDRADLH